MVSNEKVIKFLEATAQRLMLREIEIGPLNNENEDNLCIHVIERPEDDAGGAPQRFTFSATEFLCSFGMDPEDMFNEGFDRYFRPMVDGFVQYINASIEVEKKKAFISGLDDYATTEPYLFLRLLNHEQNNEQLEAVPHKDFLDLAVTICIQKDDMCANVPDSLLAAWGMTFDEVYDRLAKKVFGQFQCVELTRVIGRFLDPAESETPEMTGLDYAEAGVANILKNLQPLFGAAVMLDTNVMQQVSKFFGGRFVVIPCSVHELIVGSEAFFNGMPTSAMIRDVNQEYVEQKDQLSSHPYLFDNGSWKLL